MSNNDLVSVIIPNYNRKEELIRAILSVRQQSYKNIEIILIDDFSSFSNLKFLEDEGILESDIRIVRNTKNSGIAFSRNQGISLANGELIAFLDSDDYWEPDKIARQVSLMSRKPKFDMVYCDAYLVIKKQKLIRNTIFHDTQIWKHLINGWHPPNPSTLLIKKESLFRIGLFDRNLRHHEDFDFWLRASECFQIGFCKEILSNFSFDSKDRLSSFYEPKFLRTKIFLQKWEQKIINREGKKVYHEFENDLYFRMAVETLNSSLRNKKYKISTSVFFSHLIFKRKFYYLLLKKSLKETTHRIRKHIQFWV